MFGYWFSIFFCFCGCTKAKNDFSCPVTFAELHFMRIKCCCVRTFRIQSMQMDIVFHIERNGGNNFVLQHYFLPSFYANRRCFNGPIFMQHTCETHRERESEGGKNYVLFYLFWIVHVTNLKWLCIEKEKWGEGTHTFLFNYKNWEKSFVLIKYSLINVHTYFLHAQQMYSNNCFRKFWIHIKTALIP